MTCTGMYGSGLKTAGMTATQKRLWTGARGHEEGIAQGASGVADHGTTDRLIFVPLSATDSATATGTKEVGSVLPVRAPHETLPLAYSIRLRKTTLK